MHRIEWTCSRALTAMDTHWHIASGLKIVVIEHAHHVSASTTAQCTIFTFRNVVSDSRIVECNRHAFVDKFILGHEDLLVLYNHTYCESLFRYTLSITNIGAVHQRTGLVGIEDLLIF